MDESESKGKGDKDIILRRVATVATIAASIITITAGILTVGNYVPSIVFLTLVIILVLLIYALVTLSPPRILRKWKEARKNRALAKKYFDNFSGLLDRLGELLKDNRCDNMPYVFIHLQNMPPEFNYPRSLIYDLADLVSVFKEAMKKVQRRNFRLLIKWFCLILRLYNSQLVLQPFQQIRNLYRDKLTEHHREAYEKSREDYVRFLQDYMKFAKAINKDFGEKVAQDYFEKPGKL